MNNFPNQPLLKNDNYNIYNQEYKMMRIAKSLSSFTPLYSFCQKLKNQQEVSVTPNQKPKPTLIIRRPQIKPNQAASPQKKSYYMPERPKLQQAFMAPHKLNFKNGRCLLYLNKQNLSTPYLLDLHYLLPMSYIAYLISTNPFYLTFPAALPLMFIIQGIMIYRYIQHKAHHKRHIQRIYLLENGTQIQFIYSNKIRRFMKNNLESQVFDISSFESKYDEEIKEGKIQRYRGVRLPSDVKTSLEKARKPNALQYGWTFRDQQFLDYILPAKFEFADWQILLNVLNGVPIDLPPDYIIRQGEFMHGNFVTIEEQYKNIKNLKMSGQQKTVESRNNDQKIKEQSTVNSVDKK